MISTINRIHNLQLDLENLTEDLIIILGPTASGKTKLAVELAELIDAEIISVDSRQVYRGMDIGTGKDLQEYRNVPYHLIDILEPGDKYNINRFLEDFSEAYQQIKRRGKKVIACGGTGFYLQSLLEEKPYVHVPINENLRSILVHQSHDQLLEDLDAYTIPSDFQIDRSSKKRVIRALEILDYLKSNSNFSFVPKTVYTARVYGINPEVSIRRQRISERLFARLEEGMIEEVETLLNKGVSFSDLEYYGLEYKYISYYLNRSMSYSDFIKKLETEIHRYAKRQMTYFRKMEKDGILIKWM